MGSIHSPIGMRTSALLETSCGYLLQELQIIWDEVGEDQFEREKVLLDLEQECLEVYRRKVDTANISRARLHQQLAESEAEFTHLLLSLDERSLPGRPEKMTGTLKEQLDSITPALREMQLRKEERMNQFRAVQGQIQKISAEIAGHPEHTDSGSNVTVNKNDLSVKKFEEYQIELQRLQNEKSDRLQQVENYISAIRSLSSILGMESSLIITKVHPSLNELCGLSKNISDSILEKLNCTVGSLEEEKKQRLEKVTLIDHFEQLISMLHHLGKALTNLWNLMDTPYQDRQMFSHVSKLLSVSSSGTSEPGSLTSYIIQRAEAEVERLDQLKASKMKELFLKKQNELEEIYNRTHMGFTSRSEMDNIMNLINTGEIDHADLLRSMDEQISKAREEASSRSAIMEKVEKWIQAREEERWLEEYNMDDNRYRVSRGAHRNLKRAERARVSVNKIPGLVDSIIAKTQCWEEERQQVFLYDEVPLLAMLEEYNLSRKEKEEEKQRQREMKKVQSQVVIEHATAFSSRPSTSCRRPLNNSLNGGFSNATPLNRRLSMGMQQIGSNSIYAATQGISFKKEEKKARGRIPVRPRFSSHPRDETASVVSTFSGPLSP